MKAIRSVLALFLLMAVAGCRSTDEEATVILRPCDSIDTCTGCASTEEGVCDDKGTLTCSGSAGRCANECIHTSGALQCGHTGCACDVRCGCG